MIFLKKYKFINQKNIILLLLFILLFSIFLYFYKEKKETYLNYFLPFYDSNGLEIYDFYKKNEDNNNQTKKSFIYKNLKIGFDEDGDFIKQLGSMFVSKSFIQNIQYIKDSDEVKLLEDCNNGNLDIVNVSNPLVSNAFVEKDFKNLRFLCNTNKMYLYILTNRESTIESLSDIKKAIVSPNGFTLSVDYPNSVAHLFSKDMMNILGYNESRGDYKTIFGENGSSEASFDNLTSQKAQITIVSLPFHPKIFESRCCGAGINIFFLPFELINDDKTNVFFTKNFYYIRDIYDLNDVCSTYLPKKYGGKTYSRFSAQIPIVSYYNTLVCNNNVDDNTTYEILRTFYENISLFNQLPVFHKQPMYKTQLNAGPQNVLPINNGARTFFMDKGYITYEENESCKYLVGVEKCDYDSLEKNGFQEHGKILDSIFRFH